MPVLQEILDNTFAGLRPSAFGAKPHFLVLCKVRSPAGFESAWSDLEDENIADQKWAAADVLARTTALIVLADPVSDGLSAALKSLAAHLRAHPFVAPPVLLLPVGHVGRTSDVGRAIGGLVGQSVVDDVIWGGATGFALALAVCAKLRSLTSHLEHFQEQLDGRAARLDVREQLLSSVEFARWQYLRMRLLHAIPPTRNDVEDPEQQTVGGYQLGQRITRGAFGIVRAARPSNPQVAPAAPFTGMLVIDKHRNVRTLRDMTVINTFMVVAERLQRVPHPSVSRILDIMSSPSNLYVCMELCGPRTLFSRLSMRDSPSKGATSLRMAPNGLKALMAQLCAAICHLHIAADVCHKDVKPENVSIREQASGHIDVKLFGFELATVQGKGQTCKHACGTMPFAAPEIILAGRNGHDGKAADMWSLGVLLMEVACGLRSVEHSLLACMPDRGASGTEQKMLLPTQEIAQDVQEVFRDSQFLDGMVEKVVPEASVLKPWLRPVLGGLLQVEVPKRLSAVALQSTVE